MKSIVIAALLITLVFASLRGSDRKEQHHRRNNRHEEYSESQASEYSNEESDSDYSQYGSGYSDSDYSQSGSGYSDSNSDSDYTSDNSYNSEESYSYSESEEENNHSRPSKKEFPRIVFKTLRKIERGILEEWRLAEDINLKNDIRSLLIQNLENLLPIAEEPIDPVESQNQSPKPPKHDGHHPKPPQPEEDEFAQQVFEQLHQIGSTILDQWNVEKNIEVKNQIRADLIQQLSVLIPEVDGTIIIDTPTEINVGN